MRLPNLKNRQISDSDLDFLISTISPDVTDKARVKQIIRTDEDFRDSFIGHERVFRRVINDDEILLKISPSLFFEILLRKTVHAFQSKGFTIERTRTMNIPVFDTDELVQLLSEKPLLAYLADMLATFTRIESYTLLFRSRKGTWRKIRFNDLDIVSLKSFAEVLKEDVRVVFYKRIADICLFILGIFPRYAQWDYRYPKTVQIRPQIAGKVRINPEDYEKEGRKFYKLAAEHESSQQMELTPIFQLLHDNFKIAQKPLNFIADHYLRYRKHQLFG